MVLTGCGRCSSMSDFASDVLLALVVAEGERRPSVSATRTPAEHPAVLEGDDHGLEARGDGAAGLQDRFDEVDAREAAADAGQLRGRSARPGRRGGGT